MALTISLYNHTPRLLLQQSYANSTSIFKAILCSTATFDPTDSTMAEVVRQELPTANGYTAGGQFLSVAVSTFATNDARINAGDSIWLANGGSISADYAILIRSDLSAPPDAPLAFVDFGGTETAANGNEFRIEWNSGGIFTFVAA